MLGSIMIGITAYELNFIEKKLISHPHIGGVILFSRNYHLASQLKQLILSIQVARKTAKLAPVLIAIDHEGGIIQRLRGESFTPLPAANKIGFLYKKEPERAMEMVKALALVTAYELGSLGIDLCLGPVLDLSSGCGTSREYSTEPSVVSMIAKAYIAELQSHGLSCAGKHFPGSDIETTDTHYAVSISSVSKENLLEVHMRPYTDLISAGLLKALLLTHSIYSSVDDMPPAASKIWLQDILRKKMGFNGIIITDCLQMLGAACMGEKLKSRIFKALESGCDLMLCSHVCDGHYKEFYAAITDPDFGHVKKLCRDVSSLKKRFPDSYYMDGLQSKKYLDSVKMVRAMVAESPQEKSMFSYYYKIRVYLKKIPWLRKLKRGRLFFYLCRVLLFKRLT